MPDETTERTRRIMREFGERSEAGDETVWDDLVAADFVNHAAGPQGRDGLRSTHEHLRRDLADVTIEEHHVLADGEYAIVHMTMRGRHVGSTMPLLTGVPVTGAEVGWTFLHLWRIEDGRLAEHWACRDDVGLLHQLGAWPPMSPDGGGGQSGMQTTTPDLAPAAAEVARVVAGVRDDQLGDPTPCAGTSVAGLLDHVTGLTHAFRLSAEKTPLPGAPRASAESLPADWRTRLPDQLDALVAAWRKPEAWEGMTEAGGVRMPAGAIGLVGLNEVLVHGWDLAVATGQPYRPDDASAEACLRFAVEFGAGNPEARNSIYGPVVPVPDDATAFDRLLGQTGRDPAWSPE